MVLRAAAASLSDQRARTSSVSVGAQAVALAAALSHNQALPSLDLRRNVLQTIGAQALRQALHTNQTLTSLGKLDELPIAVGLRSSLEW